MVFDVMNLKKHLSADYILNISVAMETYYASVVSCVICRINNSKILYI